MAKSGLFLSVFCVHLSLVLSAGKLLQPETNEIAELRTEMERKLNGLITENTELKHLLQQQENTLKLLKKEVTGKAEEENKIQRELKEQKTEWKKEMEELREVIYALQANFKKQTQAMDELRKGLKKEKQKHKNVLTIPDEKFAGTLKKQTKQQEPGPRSIAAREVDPRAEALGLQGKRSDDLGLLEPVVNQLSQRVNDLSAQLQAEKNTNTAQQQAITAQKLATGSVYTRWGHAACPNTSSILYSGYVGGSWFEHTGGPSNLLCLPPNPTFDSHPIPRYGSSEIYGAEYQTCDEPECDMSVVCSVCRAPHTSTVMIPGTHTCQPGWTLQYSGYLMANFWDYSNTDYVCVDKSRDYLRGSKANQNGVLLYYVVARCGSLSCPPYVDGKIMLCAVCTQ